MIQHQARYTSYIWPINPPFLAFWSSAFYSREFAETQRLPETTEFEPVGDYNWSVYSYRFSTPSARSSRCLQCLLSCVTALSTASSFHTSRRGNCRHRFFRVQYSAETRRPHTGLELILLSFRKRPASHPWIWNVILSCWCDPVLLLCLEEVLRKFAQSDLLKHRCYSLRQLPNLQASIVDRSGLLSWDRLDSDSALATRLPFELAESLLQLAFAPLTLGSSLAASSSVEQAQNSTILAPSSSRSIRLAMLMLLMWWNTQGL